MKNLIFKTSLLIIIFIIPINSFSQTIDFDTTCFCSPIKAQVNKQGYYIIEEMPKYPGESINSFKDFIIKNTTFQQNDNGVILMYFTINCIGETCGKNIKIIEGSISESSQQSIMLALSKMQKWEPGKIRNNIVDVRFTSVIEIINGVIK